MAQLPVIIRRDIRDKFDAADSPVQQQILALRATIGLPVRVDVNWTYLWAEYERSIVDKTTFIPCVLPYMTTLLSALEEKLDEDTSEWTEKLLELLAPCQELKIDLQTSKQRDTGVRWLDRSGLALYIPTALATVSGPSLQSMLEYLNDLFETPKSTSSNEYEASDSASSMNGIQTPTSSFSFSSDFAMSKLSLEGEPSPLPKLEALPRPDQLLAQTKLHILHMRVERDRQHLMQTAGTSNIVQLPDRIIIQCTHEPSLKLIHDYFTKWTRPDMQTREKVPLMRHTMFSSAIGHGNYDTLLAEPFSQLSARSGSSLNPALYQCFIESILGYEVAYRSASGKANIASWEFRRSRPFA